MPDQTIPLQEEHARLQIEEMRLRVEQMKQAKADREEKELSHKRRAKQMAEDEKQSKAKEKARQAACQHRKGGKGFDGILNGNAADYAVIKHINPLGDMMVICQRCSKTWKQGDEGYAEACRFPTDNETSTSVTFSIPNAQNPVAAASR